MKSKLNKLFILVLSILISGSFTLSNIYASKKDEITVVSDQFIEYVTSTFSNKEKTTVLDAN